MSSKKILISSNYAWTIFNFRMNLIRRLKKEGFEVIILTQFDGYENDIKNEVDEIKPLFISRKGINPFVDLVTFFSYLKSLLFYKPSAVLLFTTTKCIQFSTCLDLILILDTISLQQWKILHIGISMFVNYIEID